VLLAAVKATVEGTVATAVLSEERLMVRGFGVAAESVRVRFCVVPPATVAVPGGKLSVAFTWTVALPDP